MSGHVGAQPLLLCRARHEVLGQEDLLTRFQFGIGEAHNIEPRMVAQQPGVEPLNGEVTGQTAEARP